MDWKEQYRHPLWQKKRLETLQAQGFVCELCGDNESQLHVHHKRYVKGRLIWEYAKEELSVLCEGCHDLTHQYHTELNEVLAKIHPEGVGIIAALVHGFCCGNGGPCGIAWFDSQASEANGTAGLAGCVAANIIDLGEEKLLKLCALIEQNKIQGILDNVD